MNPWAWAVVRSNVFRDAMAAHRAEMLATEPQPEPPAPVEPPPTDEVPDTPDEEPATPELGDET